MRRERRFGRSALAVFAVWLAAGCDTSDSGPAAGVSSTAEKVVATTVAVTAPEPTTPVTASPPEERYATIVADGPMFRLDHIWYCNYIVEDGCSWTAALTEGTLEVVDGCLYIVPSGASPNTDRIVYLAPVGSRWDPTPPGTVDVWGEPLVVGTQVFVGGHGQDVDRYLAQNSVTEYPPSLLNCAERGNGQLLTTAPFYAIGS